MPVPISMALVRIASWMIKKKEARRVKKGRGGKIKMGKEANIQRMGRNCVCLDKASALAEHKHVDYYEAASPPGAKLISFNGIHLNQTIGCLGNIVSLNVSR